MMPVAGFNYLGLAQLLRAEIALALVSEVPVSIPYCTSASQIEVEAENLPMTVIEMARATSDGTGMWNEHRLPVKIHHIRQTDPTGVALEAAMDRLQTIAVQLDADYRMRGVTVAGAPAVENTLVQGLDAGDENMLQQILDEKYQNVGLVAATLHIEIHLWETKG